MGLEIKPFDPASSSLSHIVPRHLWFFPLHHFYGLPGVPAGGQCRVSKYGGLAAGTYPTVKPSPLWSPPFGSWSPVQRDWRRQIKAGQKVGKRLGNINGRQFFCISQIWGRFMKTSERTVRDWTTVQQLMVFFLCDAAREGHDGCLSRHSEHFPTTGSEGRGRGPRTSYSCNTTFVARCDLNDPAPLLPPSSSGG